MLHVVMGTDIDNNVKGPGWYNGINYQVYAESNFDHELANLKAKELMKNNLDKFINNPSYTVRFFEKKFISTWCDPLFQSIWSCPSSNCEEYMDNSFLLSLYGEGEVNKITRGLLKAYLIIIKLLVIIYLIMNLKKYDFSILFILYFLGGVFFHLFWETKSQYVYTYVIILLPLCAQSLNMILTKFLGGKCDENCIQ